MENSKHVLRYARYSFFSIAILLGTFLSVEEFTIAQNLRNFLIFFISSVFIFLIEIFLLYGDLLKFNNLSLPKDNKTIRKTFLFNVIFIPVVNLVILMIYGLSGGSGFSYFLSSIILFLGFVGLFKYVDSNHEEEMRVKSYEGVGIDSHKLILVYLLSISVHKIFSETLNIYLSFVVFILFFFILFFLLITLNYYKRNSKDVIFFNSSSIAYISSIVLLILNLGFKDVPSSFIGLHVVLTFYSLLALTEIYFDTKKLETSILGKYLSMVLLATAILFLIK